MAHLTSANVKARIDNDTLVQLTDDTGAGVIDDDILDDIVDYANAIIDDSLRKAYALPLATASTVMMNIGISIVKCKLYERRKAIVPEYIQKEYEQALALLKDYVEGKRIFKDEGDDSNPSFYSINDRTQIYTTDVLDMY